MLRHHDALRLDFVARVEAVEQGESGRTGAQDGARLGILDGEHRVRFGEVKRRRAETTPRTATCLPARAGAWSATGARIDLGQGGEGLGGKQAMPAKRKMRTSLDRPGVAPGPTLPSASDGLHLRSQP